MPRKHLILTDQFPYHIVNRSNNKEWFYLPMETLWKIFSEKCSLMTEIYEVNIHSFVLMANHYHMLASTPKSNLSEAMTYLHRETAKSINKASARINHVFGGRYKWCLINNPLYYSHAYKYVYRNPVTAKISEKPENYRYSTLYFKVQDASTTIPVFRNSQIDSLIPKNKIEYLNWLNLPYSAGAEDLIRKALRRREFTVPRKSGTNFPGELLFANNERFIQNNVK